MGAKKATKGLPRRTHKRSKAGKYARYFANTAAKKLRNAAKQGGATS